MKQIQDLKLEVLSHPPYSPDLAPSDFHLFWPLKDALRGRHFKSNEEEKEVVHDWLVQQPKDLLQRNLCLSGTLEEVCRMWDYIEV
jgi:hypothetical protein